MLVIPAAAAATAQIQFEFLQLVNGIWLWGMVWWLNGVSMLRVICMRDDDDALHSKIRMNYVRTRNC